MNLTPTEMDRLTIFTAAEMARRNKALGIRLSHPEAVALLTDGRGNIALDGTANRAQAEEDTTRIARVIRASGLPTLVIDTAARPQPALETLARLMNAPYLALPRADAHRLSAVLSGALGG